MNAFINQVEALYKAGVLPQDVYEQMMAEAQFIIALIEASI